MVTNVVVIAMSLWYGVACIVHAANESYVQHHVTSTIKKKLILVLKELGEIDIAHLFKIYYKTQEIIKKYHLQYNFTIDAGSYETAIEFTGEKTYHPPISTNWSNNPQIFCPDLLDYNNKIIIEYEEEVGNRLPGAKLAKKGHNRIGDIPNKRDTRRNKFYNDAHFDLLQIWESDENWAAKLEKFLVNHSICKNY